MENRVGSGAVMRIVLGASILSLQIAAIAYARFVPTRYLCWAPYDEIVLYEVEVDIAGARLDEDGVKDRYRIPRWGRNNRSWAHITTFIDSYERTRGRDENAAVLMRYTVNGRGPFVWRWPEQGPHQPGTPENADE